MKKRSEMKKSWTVKNVHAIFVNMTPPGLMVSYLPVVNMKPGLEPPFT